MNNKCSAVAVHKHFSTLSNYYYKISSKCYQNTLNYSQKNLFCIIMYKLYYDFLVYKLYTVYKYDLFVCVFGCMCCVSRFSAVFRSFLLCLGDFCCVSRFLALFHDFRLRFTVFGCVLGFSW